MNIPNLLLLLLLPSLPLPPLPASRIYGGKALGIHRFRVRDWPREPQLEPLETPQFPPGFWDVAAPGVTPGINAACGGPSTGNEARNSQIRPQKWGIRGFPEGGAGSGVGAAPPAPKWSQNGPKVAPNPVKPNKNQ